MYDFHIHMYQSKWDEELPREFMKRTASAGIRGGAVFSPPPDSFVTQKISAGSWKEKLDCIFRFTSETPGFLPVFWIDPREPDAGKQVQTAAEQGIHAFKIICNRFFPKDILPLLNSIAETGLPVIFHSGILYSRYPAGEFNHPVQFECLQQIPALKFSMAHLSWPWTAELTSIAGELASHSRRYPGETCLMFTDLTPGTPKIFRRNALREYFLTGYPELENRTVWGSDCSVENYSADYAVKVLDFDRRCLSEISRDCEEYDISASRYAELFDRITTRNFRNFFNLPDDSSEKENRIRSSEK